MYKRPKLDQVFCTNQYFVFAFISGVFIYRAENVLGKFILIFTFSTLEWGRKNVTKKKNVEKNNIFLHGMKKKFYLLSGCVHFGDKT